MKSMKVTKDFSYNLLALKLTHLLNYKTLLYNLEPYDCDLFLMGRVWLTADEFNVPIQEVNSVLEQNLNTDLNDKYSNSYNFNLSVEKKISKIKNYPFGNILMDRYGDPIFKAENKLIGYKINKSECASLKTYYNDENKICNEIFIKEFNESNLTFKKDVIISWIDTKSDNGFIREFDGVKYFYDNNDNIYNVEKIFKYKDFPISTIDKKYDDKIGTLDFETFGKDLGLGEHQVYAGGWSVKGKTELFYNNDNETSEQLVNRLFLNILNQNELDGYTFYAHNLARFYSVFILKALIINEDIKFSPIWKDNGILSIVIKYKNVKIKLLDSLQLISGSLDNILN